MSTAQATNATKKPAKRLNFFTDLIKRLFKEKVMGVIGLVLVVLLFFVGIFAPLLSPEKSTTTTSAWNIAHQESRFLAPFTNSKFILGTDQLGRDVFSRLIYGARLSMYVAVVATSMQIVLSLVIGVACAYFGGWFDLIIQRFVDAWICFPYLVILITIMSIVGPGVVQIVVVLGVSSGIGGSRFMRSLVFGIRENQYIYASQAVGARSGHIMWRHILPNIMPVVIIIFSGSMGGMILAEASLSFLGLGIPAPFPSWGGMINDGRTYMLLAPGLIFWPGVALTLVVFGINMFGDALRDLLDPRLRGGLGSYRLDKGEAIAKKLRAQLEAAKPRLEQDIAGLNKK